MLRDRGTPSVRTRECAAARLGGRAWAGSRRDRPVRADASESCAIAGRDQAETHRRRQSAILAAGESFDRRRDREGELTMIRLIFLLRRKSRIVAGRISDATGARSTARWWRAMRSASERCDTSRCIDVDDAINDAMAKPAAEWRRRTTASRSCGGIPKKRSIEVLSKRRDRWPAPRCSKTSGGSSICRTRRCGSRTSIRRSIRRRRTSLRANAAAS